MLTTDISSLYYHVSSSCLSSIHLMYFSGPETCANSKCYKGLPPTQSPTPCPSGTALDLRLTTDGYPLETSFSLTETCSQTLVDQKNAGELDKAGTEYAFLYCVAENSAFEFTINDTYGDGICCGYGDGGYVIYHQGQEYTSTTGGNFGSTETIAFGTACSPTKNPTPVPTDFPTPQPTKFPTDAPTEPQPTESPTSPPTTNPTHSPTTAAPTPNPTLAPTHPPTPQPTMNPTNPPTTAAPTPNPTPAPTDSPVACTLAKLGESCTEDVDCCSNSCTRGRKANRVCQLGN